MNNTGASKRKTLPANFNFTGNSSRKRAKTNASSFSTPRPSGRDHDDDDADTIAVKPAHALSTLRNTYQQEQLEYQHNIDDLTAKLEESEEKTDMYRTKYKHGLADMVEKKTLAAENRAYDAEQKIKQLKQKHKEDIIDIRKELVAAAKDGMGQTQKDTSDPERAFEIAENALKNLKKLDPELYYELVKGQPCYVKVVEQLEAAMATIDRIPTGGELALCPDEATSECARALKELETDLVNAAADMRSNSTLSNQKKTLTKKMLASLKEVEPVFMAHAASPQAKPDGTPVPDNSMILRKNQQLRSTVNDLTTKLKDVRSKLEEEVRMRQKAEAVVSKEV